MAKFKKSEKNKSYSATEHSSSGLQKQRFAVVEAYKAIRTNLLFLLAQDNGKVITFSSAVATEGKSTTALNMAITFSQLGGKVLLIDGDLRRSSIHKKLKIENKDGLSNFLVGFSELATAVKNVNDNLDVLTGGPPPPNPSELLGSKRFAEFIEKCRAEYDYILIDTPPINIVSDALIIAPNTDGLVMVIRDGVTPKDVFARAVEAARFANINMLGTIINGTEARNIRRYSYSKYRYGYRSGYGYGRRYYSPSSYYGGRSYYSNSYYANTDYSATRESSDKTSK